MKGLFLNHNRMVLAAVCLFAIASSKALHAQQVTLLEVRKPAAEDHRTTVEFVVPMDLQGLDLDNPMDPETSGISVFVDDAGADLLEIHEDGQAGLRD